MLDNLHRVADIGRKVRDALERGDTRRFGALMHEHWEHKRVRSETMSSSRIEEYVCFQNMARNGLRRGSRNRSWRNRYHGLCE